MVAPHHARLHHSAPHRDKPCRSAPNLTAPHLTCSTRSSPSSHTWAPSGLRSTAYRSDEVSESSVADPHMHLLSGLATEAGREHGSAHWRPATHHCSMTCLVQRPSSTSRLCITSSQYCSNTHPAPRHNPRAHTAPPLHHRCPTGPQTQQSSTHPPCTLTSAPLAPPPHYP